jgi:hypothetical protein
MAGAGQSRARGSARLPHRGDYQRLSDTQRRLSIHGMRIVHRGRNVAGHGFAPPGKVTEMFSIVRGVLAELVGGAAAGIAVAEDDVVASPSAPEALPARVIARPLDPPRELAFEPLWPEQSPSAALAGFVSLASVVAARATSIRSPETVA